MQLSDYSTICSAQTPLFFFFFNDTATTEIYTLSLHDALPISPATHSPATKAGVPPKPNSRVTASHNTSVAIPTTTRSEEHTSELQSPCNLVCRLLLEKKKVPIPQAASITLPVCYKFADATACP